MVADPAAKARCWRCAVGRYGPGGQSRPYTPLATVLGLCRLAPLLAVSWQGRAGKGSESNGGTRVCLLTLYGRAVGSDGDFEGHWGFS